MGSYFAVCNTNYKFISRWPVPRQTSVRAIQLQDLGVLHLQSGAAFALLLSIAPWGVFNSTPVSSSAALLEGVFLQSCTDAGTQKRLLHT